MVWTATLLQAEDRDDYWKIIVEYTDSVRTVKRAHQFTGATTAELKAFIRAQALKLEKTDPVDLTPFVGQSIDVTPPVVVPPDPPTQDEIDEAAWLADWRTLQQYNLVLATIPALATQPRLDAAAALEASLETGWKNSYLENI